MGTLYLHIGMHKTGSTAIQDFCLFNRARLAKLGYGFPLRPFRGIPLPRNGHFLIAEAQAEDGSFETPAAQRRWERRMDKIARMLRRHPNLILSEEDIWLATKKKCPGLWRNLRQAADERGFDVRLIVYLRRQDLYLRSHWAQRVKKGNTGMAVLGCEEVAAREEEWLELDYHRKLEQIAEHFGRDRISVHVYERSRFPDGDVVLDFLNLLGIPSEGNFFRAEGDANLSLTGEALELKRAVNAAPGLTTAARLAARRAAKRLSDESSGAQPDRPSGALAALVEKYANSNQLVAKDYLHQERGRLFAPLEEVPAAGVPDGAVTPENLLRFLLLWRDEMTPRRRLARWKLRVRRGIWLVKGSLSARK